MFTYVIVNHENLKIYVGKTINPNLHEYLRRKIWSANPAEKSVLRRTKCGL